MTCIVGITDGKTVYMGADSAGVAGYSIYRRLDTKVFVNGDFIIGYTSSFRMGQLLKYSFVPPAIKEGQDIFAFMATDFIETVRSCLKEGGYARTENNEDVGGIFLVGYKGRLFRIESDFQVGEGMEPHASVGCGEEIALGSLFSTSTEKDPLQRIRIALEAAEEYSAGVRGPFRFCKLESQ